MTHSFGLGSVGRAGLIGAGIGAVGGLLTRRKDESLLNAAAGGALKGGAVGAAGGALAGRFRRPAGPALPGPRPVRGGFVTPQRPLALPQRTPRDIGGGWELLGALTPGMIQLDDGGGRSRNRDGQFEPNDGGAVDSATMAKAYGHPFGKGTGVVAAAGGTAAATLLARRLMKRRRA